MNRKIFSIFSTILLNSLFNLYLNAQQPETVDSQKILFSDDFSTDRIGQFPNNWISNRPCEVVKLKNASGTWLKMHAEGTYLPVIKKEFGRNFTVEFNMIHTASGNGNSTVEFTLFSKNDSAINDALFPGDAGIKIVFETFIVSCLCYDNSNQGNKIFRENRSNLIQANKVANIKIITDEQQLQVMVNGLTCLTIPNCHGQSTIFNASRFYLWGSMAEPLISNFSILSNQMK